MPLALFGTIGTQELVIILVIALILFGGRLPEVARSLGKSVNSFKKGLKEVDDTMNEPDPPRPTPPTTMPTSRIEPGRTPGASVEVKEPEKSAQG